MENYVHSNVAHRKRHQSARMYVSMYVWITLCDAKKCRKPNVSLALGQFSLRVCMSSLARCGGSWLLALFVPVASNQEPGQGLGMGLGQALVAATWLAAAAMGKPNVCCNNQKAITIKCHEGCY